MSWVPSYSILLIRKESNPLSVLTHVHTDSRRVYVPSVASESAASSASVECTVHSPIGTSEWSSDDQGPQAASRSS